MAEQDEPYADWPTLTKTAAILGTSERTLSRWQETGKIEVRKRVREGRKPENVVNPRDIEALKPSAHIMPAETSRELGRQEQTRPASSSPAPAFSLLPIELISPLVRFLESAATPKTEAAPFLTLEEAAAYSHLGTSFLRRAVRRKILAGGRYGPHGALRIGRASLDELAREPAK